MCSGSHECFCDQDDLYDDYPIEPDPYEEVEFEIQMFKDGKRTREEMALFLHNVYDGDNLRALEVLEDLENEKKTEGKVQ